MPIIVHSAYSIVDSKLNVIIESSYKLKGDNRDVKRLERLKQNNLLQICGVMIGCTMLFNKKVKNISFPYISTRLHDLTLSLNVSEHKDGIIHTIYEPTMLYRQHDSNTCGVDLGSVSSKFSKLSKVIKGNKRGYYFWKLRTERSLFIYLYYRIKHYLIYHSII